MTIVQIQSLITNKGDLREIINELADYLEANPSVSNGIGLDEASPESITKIWAGSQAQYDALTPDAETLYFIVP